MELQHDFRLFVLIADMQALTDNYDNPELVRDNILELACDYLALGIDPSISSIVIQSTIPELAELYMYLSNLVGIGRVERNPTVKSEIQQKGMGDRVPAGFFMYPVSQVADIVGFDADVVPVGADQAPMIELTNDIVKTFGFHYGEGVLKPVEGIYPRIGRLPSLDGKGKMSKSAGPTITFDMTDKQIAQAVNAMYPGIDGRRIEEPGRLEGNVIVTFLDQFDPDRTGLEELKQAYAKGGIGDGELKKRLTAALQAFIGPIRERRAYYSENKPLVIEALRDGTRQGREVAADVLSRVKRAMKIDYDSYFSTF